MKLLVITLITGILAGLLGSLCGVGGGIVMVPAFTHFLNLSQKEAVATSLAVIVLISLASTINSHSTSNLIQWKIVACVGISAILASWIGTDLMRALSNQSLTRIFACVLIGFGIHMLLKP